MLTSYVVNFDELAQEIVLKLKKNFDFDPPIKMIDGLAELYSAVGEVPDVKGTFCIRRIYIQPADDIAEDIVFFIRKVPIFEGYKTKDGIELIFDGVFILRDLKRDTRFFSLSKETTFTVEILRLRDI